MSASQRLVSLVNGASSWPGISQPPMPRLPERLSTSSVFASGASSCSVSDSGGPVCAIVGISDLVSDVLQHPFEISS